MLNSRSALMAFGSPASRRLLVRMIGLVLALDALAIALWYALHMPARQQGAQTQFVVVWTVATLAIVLVHLQRIRRIRDSAIGRRRAVKVIVTALGAGGLVAGAHPASAQTDWYNLDGGRPVRVEDAVATPRHELELQFLPLRVERLAGGLTRTRAEPKLALGAFAFTELELRVPILATSATATSASTVGMAGLAIGALHAFNLETQHVPALALSGEGSLPVGPLAARGTSWLAKGLATKTFSWARLHVNVGAGTYSLAAPRAPRLTGLCGAVNGPACLPAPPSPPDPPCALLPAGAFAECFGAPTLASAAVVVTDPRGYGPRWVAGAGADHSFPRLSTLVVVDVVAERFVHLYDRIDVTAEIGLRHQLAPQLVVDLGVGRHFLGTLLSTSATLGLSYGMPLFVRVGPRDAAPARAADARAPAFVRVADEQTYLPRDHNWTFRRRYPAADRLLNAFDYGHAILYETLITAGSDAPRRLDGPVRRFVIDHVLAPGEPVPLEERAIGPRYATLAPELLATFAWAHQLHRQVYDVLADEWLGPADKDSAVAELLRYYRSRPDLALSSRPKSMMLMEGQPFSTEFRHASPMYNGLIWSYHWMQMALYDALLRGADVHERARLVDSTVARFRAMAMGNGLRMPMVMPMSAAVAPDFSARYPEAAIIFDNLHSLHDVVSDILISPLVPAREKRRQLLAAAASYRDDVTAVTTRAEWAEMARSMDVNMMGGVAVPETRQP